MISKSKRRKLFWPSFALTALISFSHLTGFSIDNTRNWKIEEAHKAREAQFTKNIKELDPTPEEAELIKKALGTACLVSVIEVNNPNDPPRRKVITVSEQDVKFKDGKAYIDDRYSRK